MRGDKCRMQSNKPMSVRREPVGDPETHSARPMLILIENGDLYDPEPRGQTSLLLAHDRILRIDQQMDRRVFDRLSIEYEFIDASGCYITPGLIDPHQHLLGGSGERGFATQTPQIFLHEIVIGGITT